MNAISTYPKCTPHASSLVCSLPASSFYQCIWRRLDSLLSYFKNCESVTILEHGTCSNLNPVPSQWSLISGSRTNFPLLLEMVALCLHTQVIPLYHGRTTMSFPLVLNLAPNSFLNIVHSNSIKFDHQKKKTLSNRDSFNVKLHLNNLFLLWKCTGEDRSLGTLRENLRLVTISCLCPQLTNSCYLWACSFPNSCLEKRLLKGLFLPLWCFLKTSMA